MTPAFSAAEWDERYAQPFASYGAEPNDFVRAVAGRVPPGPVLVIAAGEGRDAVFFAERGHEVTAVDLSRVALDHAEALARERGVTLTTVAGDLADFDLGESRWAAIVSVWAHVPPALRRTVHAACARALQPGGVFILEIYAPAQLELPGAGGPSVVELLLDVDAARQELQGLELELCQETRRLVAEGQHHRGVSATTQVLGARPA
ncbi:MAG: class I SAM-dependent methyltransferase [Myxococcales bacterium]|nr:class I SAM-dependent methyltransferase [Myxococcales bacterium]